MIILLTAYSTLFPVHFVFTFGWMDFAAKQVIYSVTGWRITGWCSFWRFALVFAWSGQASVIQLNILFQMMKMQMREREMLLTLRS